MGLMYAGTECILPLAGIRKDNMKNIPFIFVVVIVLSLVSGICYADWTMDFVRITCIPEARYLHVKYTPVDGSAVDVGVDFHNKKKRKQRLAIWNKHGYFDPSMKIQYKCRMPESTYTISAIQPPPRSRGECGVSQSITLSLLRNGKPLLNKILLGHNCWRGPVVDEFEIMDGIEGGENRRMALCISSQADSRTVCEQLPETYGIDHEGLEKYLEKYKR